MKHEQVIHKFGGPAVLAELTGQKERAVRGWKERKRIPSKHWPVIVKVASQQGLPVTYETLATG